MGGHSRGGHGGHGGGHGGHGGYGGGGHGGYSGQPYPPQTGYGAPPPHGGQPYPPQGGQPSGFAAPPPYGGQPYPPQQPPGFGAPPPHAAQPYPAQWAAPHSSGHGSGGLPRMVTWLFVLIGLVVWSAVAALAYVLVDPILGWLASNAGGLVDQGAGLATTLGAGKEATGNIVNNLNVKGFLGQTISVLRSFARPAIVIVWAIGAVLIMVGPSIKRRLGGFHGMRSH